MKQSKLRRNLSGKAALAALTMVGAILTSLVLSTTLVSAQGNGNNVDLTGEGAKLQKTPVVECVSLMAEPTGKPNEYKLTAKANVQNDTILAYDFSIGSSGKQKVETNANTVSITKEIHPDAGSALQVSVKTLTQGAVTSPGCKTSVAFPVYECGSLTGAVPVGRKVTFTANPKAANGANLKSVLFDFGDGKTTNKPVNSNEPVVIEHEYAEDKTYSASATLTYDVAGQTLTAPACRAVVEVSLTHPVEPPAPECRPGVRVGDPACQPCQYNSALPASDPNCLAPNGALPTTGPGDVVVIGLLVTVMAVVGYRIYTTRRNQQAALAVAGRGKKSPSTRRSGGSAARAASARSNKTSLRGRRR